MFSINFIYLIILKIYQAQGGCVELGDFCLLSSQCCLGYCTWGFTCKENPSDITTTPSPALTTHKACIKDYGQCQTDNTCCSKNCNFSVYNEETQEWMGDCISSLYINTNSSLGTKPEMTTEYREPNRTTKTYLEKQSTRITWEDEQTKDPASATEAQMWNQSGLSLESKNDPAIDLNVISFEEMLERLQNISNEDFRFK